MPHAAGCAHSSSRQPCGLRQWEKWMLVWKALWTKPTQAAGQNRDVCSYRKEPNRPTRPTVIQPYFTTSLTRDLHREQSSSEEAVPGAPYEGAATKPKGSAALGEGKSTTLRRPTARPIGYKKSRSKNSWVPNVDLHH